MDGDSADAMLGVMDEVMHEDRHEGRYRRIEVITGRRQRRNWTPEEKARIIAESAEADVNISAVARRWGVNRGLLNVWRREAGLTPQRCGSPPSRPPMFVPVTMVDNQIREKAGPGAGDGISVGRIEVEIAGAHLVVTGPVAPELAHAVVMALRGSR